MDEPDSWLNDLLAEVPEESDSVITGDAFSEVLALISGAKSELAMHSLEDLKDQTVFSPCARRFCFRRLAFLSDDIDFLATLPVCFR